jgi:CHAD domain-containing protein
MKYKHAIGKYFEKRSSKINYFLKLHPENYKPETFHKLRTEIKKINAVFDILNDCDPDFKRTKTFNPLQAVFKNAGAVRDIQVKKVLFEKYKITSVKNGLTKQLEEALKRSKAKFRKQITKKTIKGIKKSLSTSVKSIAALKHKDVNRYFKKEEKKIKQLLKQHAAAKKLHPLRRQLKSFYYNLKAAGWNSRDIPFNKMDAIQELLGKWHDGRVAEKYIAEQKVEKGTNKMEKKRFDRIKAQLHKENSFLIEQAEAENRELAKKINMFN